MPRGGLPTPPEVKVWERVERRGPDECWLWLGVTNDGGYGLLTFGSIIDGSRSSMTASRAVWISVHGPIPRGLMVRHTCDNPPCCNPAHLLSGTGKDNAQDMIQRGRKAKRHQWAPRVLKLSDDDIREMRRLRAGGMQAGEVAHRFGVSEPYASRVCRRVAKAHVFG